MSGQGCSHGLSRRTFLGVTASLAAAYGIPKALLGTALAAPLSPADVPTTLRETILQRTTGTRGYRTLTTAAGEPYEVRTDLLGRDASPGRTGSRRSIAYIGHTSDIHIIDAQSPARLEAVSEFSTTLIPGNFRPQEAMSVFVQAQMVQALRDASKSPVTGAPMAAVVNTGDSADMLSNLELRWYIDVMDGTSVMPNSGKSNVYEGVQAWAEASYAWHPEDPSKDPFGTYGFPRIPGLMDAVVSQEVTSPGLPAPWYTVYGNHDTLFNGVFGTDASLRNLATGDKKPYAFESMVSNYLTGMAMDTSPMTRAMEALKQQFGREAGFKKVTADPARKLLDANEFVKAHFQTTSLPGPVGHGFTQDNLDSGKTYWTADVGEHLRLFGLDTCNQVVGADGAVPEDQFVWLEDGLKQAVEQNKFAIVLSHHNSLTLENSAVSVNDPGQRLVHAEEFVAMLLKYPNMVAWLNGHTHINTVQAHGNPTPARRRQGYEPSGFWEITTASCADYPQQQQVVEIVDNRDGSISLFATVLDHASPAQWREGDFSQEGIASLSRELASNDWVASPLMRRGSPLDRNVELLLAAPFDLTKISDASLEVSRAEATARAMAGGQR